MPLRLLTSKQLFQHTAARRRLPVVLVRDNYLCQVSTHSRPKAAAMAMPSKTSPPGVSTHSRPKAAAGNYFGSTNYAKVSTHSRPKAAAMFNYQRVWHKAFQHTAARRRLRNNPEFIRHNNDRFNTQPPEGGCFFQKFLT